MPNKFKDLPKIICLVISLLTLLCAKTIPAQSQKLMASGFIPPSTLRNNANAPIITPQITPIPKTIDNDINGLTNKNKSNKQVKVKVNYNQEENKNTNSIPDSLSPSTQDGMTVLQALDEALIKSPRAAAIRAQLPITQAEMVRATQIPNPAFFFDRGLYAEQVRRIGPILTVDPPWKLAFRLLESSRLVKQTKVELLAQLWALRIEVRRIYAELIVAQETLKTLKLLLDLAVQLRDVSEKRFAAGDVPELDLLRAKLAANQADVDVQVGLRRLYRAKQQLNIILGRSTENALTVPRLPTLLTPVPPATYKLGVEQTGILPDLTKHMPPLQHFMEIAFGNRLELKAITASIQTNKASKLRAFGDIVPDPSVAFGSSTNGNAPSGPKLSSLFVTLNIPTPISDWNQGNIAKFNATATQLKYQYMSQKNVVTADVSSAYNNVLAARRKLRVYQEKILANSYEVAKLARRSYEVGQSDITTTLNVLQENIRIRTQYLDAITLYQQNFADLELACNKPLQ